jgi:hypothetical protein
VKEESNRARRKWLYVVAPFCWLLLCLGSINVATWWKSRPLKQLPVTITAVSMPTPIPTTIEPTANDLSNLPQPKATVIAIPGPTATPYTPPIYSTDTIIQLLGPPPGSAFAHTATISFYWQWPLPLTEDQEFRVYLFAEDQVVLWGTINEPNVGDSYRLQVALEDVRLTADKLHWFVQLETTHLDQPLQVSETRSLTILVSSLTP